MPEYKNVLSVWLNVSKDGKGCYLAIKNDSDERIVIEPGKSIYANVNNRLPVASKSVKTEDSESVAQDAMEALAGEKNSGSTPF